MGGCGTPLTSGEVAWSCEDCEKDPTAVICKQCYEKGNHEGHRTWLKTDITGYCDCGDSTGWAEEGFCSDHKSSPESLEKMFANLPVWFKASSEKVFYLLAKSLKKLLLNLIDEID